MAVETRRPRMRNRATQTEAEALLLLTPAPLTAQRMVRLVLLLINASLLLAFIAALPSADARPLSANNYLPSSFVEPFRSIFSVSLVVVASKFLVTRQCRRYHHSGTPGTYRRRCHRILGCSSCGLLTSTEASPGNRGGGGSHRRNNLGKRELESIPPRHFLPQIRGMEKGTNKRPPQQERSMKCHPRPICTPPSFPRPRRKAKGIYLLS